MKEFLLRRRVLALLSALVFGLARQGSAQNSPITDYTNLINALNAGITTITNFQTPLTISLTSGQTLQITNNVTINAGTSSVIIQGDGGERLFYVHPNAALTLNNLELTNGLSTNGGAIYNEGTLIISNCLLTGNRATNSGGAAGGNGPPGGNGNGTNGGSGGMAAGGAIYSTGPVIISYSILSNNIAEAGDGGSGGSATGEAGNGGGAGFGGNAYGGALYSTGSSNVFYMTEFAGNVCFAGTGGLGGIYATNGPAGPSGAGGAGGLGGSCAGGAAFVTGSLYMTNCLFAMNFAVAGSTGPAEVDSDGAGPNGSPGGSALGGALFITNGAVSAWIENSIFFTNACYGGYGGSTVLSNVIGGTGGEAQGGGVWSGAALTQMGFCTLATNYVVGGPGGTNTAARTFGATGAASGYLIYRSAGLFNLSASILSGYNSSSDNQNAVGVTDAGYNVSSDASPAKSTIITTTKLNTNPDLNSGFSTFGAAIIGGTNGSQPMLALAIPTNSPAASFVPGVPGSTFPATDEVLQDRGTPTSAGAYEANPITISNNAVLPTISPINPATILTGNGGTVTITAVASSSQPFGYQWQLDSNNISDSANYSGTTSNVLTIKKITIADQGYYTVIVSPTLLEGAVTSSVVELILTNPPVIKKQIVGQLNRPVGSIVTFTLGVGSFPQAYSYLWLFSSNSSGAISLTNLEGGNIFITNNVLTIDPALMNDAGTYSVIVSNNYGVKKSVNVRLTVVPDHSRPTVTITSPLANSRTNTASNLLIEGTAKDNAQVTNVMYWLTNINAGLIPVTNVLSGNATLSTTNVNTNLNGSSTKFWSIAITNLLWPGTNILAVQSVDYSSNVSTVVHRRFFYQVPFVFNLTIWSNGGGGTVTNHAFIKGDASPSNGASLNIGEGYSLVARPNATSLLGRWTNSNTSETNVVITNGNTLKFIMESNTAIQALFVSNIFLREGVHGTYNGLFHMTNVIVTTNVVTNSVTNYVGVTNAVTNTFDITNQTVTLETAFTNAGMLNNLAIGRQGSFSGRLLLAGGSYGLSGTFDAFGHVTNHIVARSPARGGPLIIDMNVDTNGAGVITGTVSNAAWPTNACLWADLAAATPGTSHYTLLMFPTGEALTNMVGPAGDGYALIADHGGTVTLSGGLADGTTFNQTVPASQSNNIPVYASLYGRTGFLFGWLNLTNLNSTNGTNGLIWIKGPTTRPTLLFPDGFTNMLLTEGSPWINPGVITLSSSNTLAISNADLDLNYTVAIDEPDKLVNASGTPANSLSGTINLNTGLLQVKFGNGNGRSITVGHGAMLQDTTNAGGYFVLGTNAGSVTLNASGSPPLPSDVLIQYLQYPLSVQDQQYAEYQYLTNLGAPLPPSLPPPQAVLIDGSGSPPP